MSRAVTFPKSKWDEDVGLDYEDHEDRLVEVECLREGCAWWVEHENECAIKTLAILAWAKSEEDQP